ncbi:MAG: DUF4129 domain-containing protein, partial [Verrucomicrobiota bacterium]
LAMAADLLARGEYRLAARALFLASLAFLAHQEYIRLALFKSNREYLYELKRRSHGQPELPGAFSDVIQEFEGFWYGQHPIDEQIARQFQTRVEEVRAHAQ